MDNASGIELQDGQKEQQTQNEAPTSRRDQNLVQFSEDNLFKQSVKKVHNGEKQIIHADEVFESGQLVLRDLIESGQLYSHEGDSCQRSPDSKILKAALSHQSSENEDIQVEQMIEYIRIKQQEVEGETNTQLLIEMTKLIIETQEDRLLKVRANKIVGLYLSFYGLWREAEKLLRWNEQFEMSSSTNKGVLDVYDSILEIIDNQNVMSGILKLCCRSGNDINTNKNINSKKQQLQQADGSSPRKSNMQTNVNIKGVQILGEGDSSKVNKLDSEGEEIQPEIVASKEQPSLQVEGISNQNNPHKSIQCIEDFIIQEVEDGDQAQDNNNYPEIQMKEVLIVNIIQTFNLRMNVISQDLCEWLIEHEQLNIIELLLENQRMSASTKRMNYEQTKYQEKKMLKYFQEYLVIASGLYNNEIELLLNLNENGLQILSMEYTRFLIKYLKIPANYIVNRSLIKEAVCQQNVPLISQMIKYSREMTQETLLSSRVQNLVKGFLEKSETFVCGLYFLKKMSQKKQRESQSSEYFDHILRLLSRPENDEQFTLELTAHCLHPLVICLICSKILLKLSMGKNPFSSEMLKLANFYLQRALSYRDAIFDAREMSILIFKPIFPSDKPLIKALRSSKYSSFFTDFFVHPCISYLLEQKFMSTYGWDKMIFGAFTPMSHFLNHSKIKNPYAKNQISQSSSSSYTKSMKSVSGNSFSLEPRKQNWFVFKDIELSNLDKISKNNHIFSFAIFNKSVAVRLLVEFIVFLMISGYTMYYLFQFIDNFNVFITTNQDTKTLLFERKIPTFLQAGLEAYKKSHSMPDLGVSSSTDESYLSSNPTLVCELLLIEISYGYPAFMDYFTSSCTVLVVTGQALNSLLTKVIVACCLFMTLGANVIQKQIYTYLIGKITDLSVIDYYDMLLSLICVSFIVIQQGFIPQGISNNYTLDYFTQCTELMKYASCCIVFLIWIRLFLFLIRSQRIGILVRIIILFIKDLSQFIIVLVTILLAFGTLNYILFQNYLEIYSTFQVAIYNLIAAVFGAFDFNDQNWIQSLILIIFLFIANIVMMNLLIAILNSRYETTMQQSEMEYALVVYNDYINLRFHPLYSCMITLPPPLNVVNFILGIPALIFKSRKWNNFALKLQYIVFILLPLSIVFISVSIITMPLAFLFMAYRLMLFSVSDNLMNARKKPIYYRIAIGQFRLLSWLILGIPYLLIVLVINDIPLFFKSAFSHVNNKYTFTKNQILDIRVLRYAAVTSNYLHSSHSQVVNYVDFRNALENKKSFKNNAGIAKSIFSTFRINQARQFQQLRQTSQQQQQQSNIEQNTLQPEKIVEKYFNGAIKKFGDGKSKNDAECVSLRYLLNSIKYSAIFFRKSKRTSLHLSRLLYIVRKKEQLDNLLEQNSGNFFLKKTFSFQNVGMAPQEMS